MFKVLLFPFAVLYDIATRIRNKLYDLEYRPSAKFEIPVIGVGNLTVGGTGKSPMIEYLVRLLSPRYKLATLSRGYGRLTKGVRIASSEDNASTIGDEPFQFYKKFNDKITVSVGEERAFAIPHILHQRPEIEVVLLDDAFQHRQVTPSFQILLTDYNRLFINDWLLPTGRLRESRTGARRADVVVITKCPADISEKQQTELEGLVKRYTDKKVFLSTVKYGLPVPFGANKALDEKVILVSGIANPKPLEQHLEGKYNIRKHFAFADHHMYTLEEIKRVVELAHREDAAIVTTEKDAAKLDAEPFKTILSQIPCFYLPIEMEFIKSGKDFDEMVLQIIHHQTLEQTLSTND